MVDFATLIFCGLMLMLFLQSSENLTDFFKMFFECSICCNNDSKVNEIKCEFSYDFIEEKFQMEWKVF